MVHDRWSIADPGLSLFTAPVGYNFVVIARLLLPVIVAVAAVLCLWVTPHTGDPGVDRPLQLTLVLILLVYVPYSFYTGWKAAQEKPKQKGSSVHNDKP